MNAETVRLHWAPPRIRAASVTARSLLLLLVTFPLASSQPSKGNSPKPPQILREAIGYAPLVWSDGTVEHFYVEGIDGNQSVIRTRSKDGGLAWSSPEPVLTLPKEGKWYQQCCQPFVDREGTLHLFILDLGTSAATMTTWHTRLNLADKKWSTLRKIAPSLPQNVPIQLRSGRIVFPVGYFGGARGFDDPLPRTMLAVYYSDDSGQSWHRSPQTLSIRCPDSYQGPGTGGHEPVMVELQNGSVWMVIRTQTGWLYESFSRDGIAWSEPQATKFRSSNGPGSLVRLSSGELVLFWNNNDMPSPVDGRWIYTGRDALHAAISPDDGKTWEGFREVYRDPVRNEDPPLHGDRGTAYPNAAATPDGHIILVAGQGAKRRKILRIDPAWLKSRRHEDDFSRGLDEWSVFKSYGPVTSYRRRRVPGAERLHHPDTEGAWVLHVRRPDEKAGDGAVWNFPAGRTGRVTVRILLNKGFGGGLINLTDRFIYPDDANPAKVVFSLPIAPDGSLGSGGKLQHGRWYTLELAWKVEHKPPQGGWPGECVIKVDGQEVAVLPQLYRARSGLSYIRLHSTATNVDPAGMLIDHIAADVVP